MRRLPPIARWQLDTLAGALLAAGTIGYAIARGGILSDWQPEVGALLSVAMVGARRRWPVPAAATCIAVVAAISLSRHAGVLNDSAGTLFTWVPFVLAYGLGANARFWPGLIGAVLLAGALQLTSASFNPFYEMLTLPAWFAGCLLRSKRGTNARLEERNRELEAERDRYARERVHYERARIARDLHDIVAHGLSVVVVQATAAQRLLDVDPSAVHEAMEAIADAAGEAKTELGQLMGLVGGSSDVSMRPGSIEDLVRRAKATGTAVRYQADPGVARSKVAYRVVQESLTNAIKHAPGAEIDVAVRQRGDRVVVEVTNAAPSSDLSGLEQSGARRGLLGLRERVGACGGALEAGPTAGGGWRVSAALPLEASLQLDPA